MPWPIWHSFDRVFFILVIMQIAVNLRQKREDNGALIIDQIIDKLKYITDDDTGLPTGIKVIKMKDSNK